MSRTGRMGWMLITGAAVVAMLGSAPHAQQAQSRKPPQLPNPYRLVEGWPTLPLSMNAGQWGEVIRVHVHSDGNIWVFHRCFNTVPPGHATCVGRGDLNPPILQFDPAGRLLTSFGAGLFAYPHGFTVDREGNLWASDVNDEATILGLSAKTAEGAIKGQEVVKLSPTGKVLMMLGKEGVSGNGPDVFDRPTGIAVAPNGDIFVSDGHYPNKHENARVMKFAKDGSFIKAWGQKGAAPGDFDEPHDIFLGGSQNRLYVADRRNNRIQVFDQDGNFLAAWKSIRNSELRVRREGRHHLCGRRLQGRDGQARRGPGHRDRERRRRHAQGLHSGPSRPRYHECRNIGVGHCGRRCRQHLRGRRCRPQFAEIR